jgi:hypothetical protein
MHVIPAIADEDTFLEDGLVGDTGVARAITGRGSLGRRPVVPQRRADLPAPTNNVSMFVTLPKGGE